MWESGLEVGYTNWSPSNPDNYNHGGCHENCLEFIWGATKQWNDVCCHWNVLKPICQLKGVKYRTVWFL